MDMVDDMLMDPNVEKCAVCGDRSNGKHYGVAACYGCKGFFRRTIRSSQSYACRFNAKCMIDKDQRNACRYCRFKRCLEVGMEPEAIRPDRDVIGKQKNPRKRKMKRESSSLPSPGNLDNLTQHETFNYMDNGDMLLSYLIDIEMKNHQTQTQFQNAFNSPIGIARHFNKVKADPDCNTYSLLASSTALNSFREPIPGEAGRVATVEQFNHAMRSYVILAIDWVNSLFELAQIDNMSEKMVMLKNAFGPFCTLHKATTTSQYGGDDDTVVLCNGSLVPRNLPRHLFEMQFFANNIVGKLIDEVVLPLRRFMINDVERSALIALTFLDGEFRGMSEQSVAQLNTVKERIQMALFQAIKERTSGVSTAASRFAGLLMTLPSVAKLSTLYIENVQMAQMFGAQQMDRFVVEVVTNAPTTPEPLSPSKHKCDVETQTHRFTESEELGRIGNELVALGLDLSANPPMISAGTSSETTTSPLPSISSSSSSLSTQTTLNKPPPLVVQHHHQHIHSNNSSHHNSPIASSAPVYPFNYGYSNQSYQNGQQQQQQQQQQQLAQQMPQFPYNSVHSNGIQSAGPFNQQTFFNQIQHSQSAHVDYHQQSCFKF